MFVQTLNNCVHVLVILAMLDVRSVHLVQLDLKDSKSSWEYHDSASRFICTDSTESVSLGPNTLPVHTVFIQIENCGKLEIESRLLNHLSNVNNITIRSVDKVIVNADIFDAKGSEGSSYSLDTIEFHNIRDLQIRRYAFRGVEILNRFYLGEVQMAAVVPMALNFDYVKEFSVFASKFDRLSMWAIKITKCGELNILGMTHFASLAAHAIKASCEKFSMAYNWFGNIHDSAFEVEYVLSDIQGNTFNSLGGNPFIDLKPIPPEGGKSQLTGFVFRENKFISDPVLPFGSLAMPSFDKLHKEDSYIDIDNNQFPCECDAVGWLLAYGQHGYNSKSIGEIAKVKGTGSLNFIRQLYLTSGLCLKCIHSECKSTDERLVEYAANSIIVDDGVLRCGSGVVIKNYDSTSSEPDLIILPKSWKHSKDDSTTNDLTTPRTSTTGYKAPNPTSSGSQIQLDPSVYTQGNMAAKFNSSFLAILIMTVVPLI